MKGLVFFAITLISISSISAEGVSADEFAIRLEALSQDPKSTDHDFASLLEAFELPEEGFEDPTQDEVFECLRLITQIYFMASPSGKTDATVSSKADIVVYAAKGVPKIRRLIERHPEGRIPFEELGKTTFEEANRMSFEREEREKANKTLQPTPDPPGGKAEDG